MSRRDLIALSLLSLLAAAPGGRADVQVPYPVPDFADPSPGARTCELQFRRHTPVVTSCQQTCYAESWDGPILLAANTCTFPISVSYVYSAADGRTWRTPCYALEPEGDPVAIPENTIDRWADRRIVLSQEPGTMGYTMRAPSPDCPEGRQVQPSTSGQ